MANQLDLKKKKKKKKKKESQIETSLRENESSWSQGELLVIGEKFTNIFFFIVGCLIIEHCTNGNQQTYTSY